MTNSYSLPLNINEIRRTLCSARVLLIYSCIMYLLNNIKEKKTKKSQHDKKHKVTPKNSVFP